MPRSRSARAAEPLSEDAIFTKTLLSETKISYLKELTFPEKPQVDIVAVHGLNVFGKTNAFAVRTWLYVDTKAKKEILWLKDILPKQLPDARVLLFAYNSNVGLNTSTGGMSGAAQDLLARLRVKRQNDPHRPVVFLAHSLGGIVVKHAIAMAKTSLEYADLYPSIRAIAFFATPHRGGLFARQGQAAAGLLQITTRNARSSNLEALRVDSHIAPETHRLFKFCLLDKKIRVCSFCETRPMSILKYLIVDGTSAKLDITESLEFIYEVPESNHSTICKFDGHPEDYEVVMGKIIGLVEWACTPPASIPDVLVPPESSHSTSASPPVSISSSLNPEPEPQRLLLHGSFSRPNSFVRGAQDNGANPKAFYLLPNQVDNPKFTGRQSTLDLVQGLLSQQQEEQTRIALYGLGGVGKTQIALRVLSWYRKANPSHSIFWLSGRNTEAFRESLFNVAAECGLVRQDDNTAEHLGQVYDFLLQGKNGKWLIFIDNADDTDTFGITAGGSKQNAVLGKYRSLPIINWIPECPHGKIVITTNSKIVGERLSLYGHVEEIRHMNQSESTTLFKRQFGEVPSSIDSLPAYQREIPNDQDIQRLCERLEHLPLAVTQAAAFMREQSQTVTGYLDLLTKDDGFWNLFNQNLHKNGIEDDFSKAVASTWKVAFDQIETKWPRAADILSIMAFLDTEAIPKSLLKKFEPNESKLSIDGLGTLQGYALIYPDATGETFRVHRLIQIAIRQRLHDQKTTDRWASITLNLLTDLFSDMDDLSHETYIILLPHAQQILRYEFSGNPADTVLLVKLASSVSYHQLEDGNFAEADIYGEMAWDYVRSISNPEKSLELDVKAIWAQALRKANQVGKAEALIKEAWAGQKKLHGKTSSQALKLARILSAIYQDQGYYDASAKIARETLKSLEKKLKDKNPTADDIKFYNTGARPRLAIILEKLGEYKEAEKVIQGVLQVASATNQSDPDDQHVLKSKWRLAYILHSMEMYEESYDLAMKTWTAQKRVIGERHVECVTTYLLVANNLEACGKIDRALSIKKDIYENSVKILGFEHRYTIITSENVASGLLASAAEMSRKEAAEAYREAERLYESAIEWFIANLRPGHPDLLAVKTGLATTLRLQGQFQEAEDVQRGALKLKTGLSSAHPIILAAEENLARILWEGKSSLQGVREEKSIVKEAMKLASQVLKAREKKIGWSRRTARTAELVVEMLPDGKQKVELQKKLDERTPLYEERSVSKADDDDNNNDSIVEREDAENSDEKPKEKST